ncbi:hypothetical protein CVT26_006528 [Gymnopilus dilepis]|uniref:Neprosin domain-containing protein n=1 Tax=Gymnopilus dilepis TaxID=231916 RepID=A0A409Y3D8_9AGAR|nr:hypothetical protein CVT26_006528 [Gymnopilus dilepis]
MSLKKLFSCALLALHALDVIASPVDKTAGDLMRTPAGLVPRSNVHAVPKGAQVHQTPTEIQVIGSNGIILHSVPYDKSPKATVNPLRRPTNGSFANPRALPDGYVAYAYWHNPSSSVISDFVTVWTVPPVPSNVDGQLLYWFNALIPPSDDAILQPVLQFGVSPAGGGPYYSIASWYVLQGHAYFSELVENVAPGQELAGYMILANTMTSGSTTQIRVGGVFWWISRYNPYYGDN